MFFLFCFKQKTAYEMRISDWSSDVFSSDLITIHYAGAFTGYGPLIAGPEGLSYFTIRSIHEEGANILPHAASQMLKGPRRGGQAGPLVRSEERRVGKECVSQGRSRWSPSH